MTDPDTSADYFRPPWAVTAFVDDFAVYIEIPNKSGPPYITSFALTDGGLGKALNFMREEYHKRQSPKFKAPKPSVTLAPKVVNKFSDRQRSAALEILRKRGIV